MMHSAADFRIITAKELMAWLAEGRSLVLVDTLPEDHYRKVHLPGSKNVCVYQVTFVDQILDMIADKEQLIVLYGASEHSRDALTAAEKLVRAGYQNIFVVAGGLRAWHELGGRLEGEAPDAVAESPRLVLENRLYEVDTERSIIHWAGRNPNTLHFGTVRFSEGAISVHHKTATGSFTIDMSTIASGSLAGNPLKPVLEAHLASDDFFFVEKHPTARFTIESARVADEPTLSAPNLEVRGDLELVGVRKEIEFVATLNNLDDGALAAEAHFDIDRTQWGVVYGSSRFFEHLGMHLVFDLISIQLRIVAR